MKKPLVFALTLCLLTVCACAEASFTSRDDVCAALEGSWQDSFSQRAALEIVNDETGCYAVVSWADSAESTESWSMHLIPTDDGLLAYDDCIHAIGGDLMEIVYESGEGFFTPSEDLTTLYWNGAADESCVDCVFEKIPE